MIYPVLASAFILTILGFPIFLYKIISKKKSKKYLKFYTLWLICYSLFIVFGTGPSDNRIKSTNSLSPYKLPWKEGVKRFVSQGNNSFTSHRELHHYAWDFWMPIGTEILASRGGTVTKVIQHFDGIGLDSNYIYIQHDDKTVAMYAHIKKDGSLIKQGETVTQGQPIALSGMVGQTLNPHLHFVVFNQDLTKSLPISFNDLNKGIPMAGSFYQSKNKL